MANVSPPRLLSWGVSLVIHASVLVGLIYILPRLKPDVGPSAKEQTQILLESFDDEPAEETDLAIEAPVVNQAKTENADTLETVVADLGTLPPLVEPTTVAKPQPLVISANQSSNETGLGLGKAVLRVFGNEAVGNRFVFLFDRSVSMDGPPLRAAQSQLISGLRCLGTNHQFQIVFFNHEPQLWEYAADQRGMVAATSVNRDSAEEYVQEIAARGGTYRRSALLMALSLRPDVIYFLTDADAPMASGDVAEAIRLAKRQQTAIHSIEFGIFPKPTRMNFLKQLARHTRGDYVYVNMEELP